jgi:hypothetical protein
MSKTEAGIALWDAAATLIVDLIRRHCETPHGVPGNAKEQRTNATSHRNAGGVNHSLLKAVAQPRLTEDRRTYRPLPDSDSGTHGCSINMTLVRT